MSSAMTAILFGLVAAILYGIGAAVQQHPAALAPATTAGRPRLLLHLARQPLWLAGAIVQVVGLILHAVALRFGALAVVQMLVATSLIFSVVTVRIRSRQKLTPTAWTAAAAVVAGVGLFLLLTAPPAHPRHHGHAPHHQILAAALTLGIVTVIVIACGFRASGTRRAGLLAAGAGLLDTGLAVATMEFTHVAPHGPVAIGLSWSTYALIVCGLGSLLITQSAFQAGYPLIALPVLAAVTPAASVAVGFGLLEETIRAGTVNVLGAGVAVVATSVGLAVLARSAPAQAGGA
jgi:drug/metabolite transporter (DMT)-like permease